MADFNPDARAGEDSGIFGLETSYSDSQLIFIPAPWDATTSYGEGTADGPEAILNASHQVDLFDCDVLKPYEVGFYLEAAHPEAKKRSDETRKWVEKLRNGKPDSQLLSKVNAAGDWLNRQVYDNAKKIYADGKWAALIGGDHSVSFGAIQACAERTPKLGILHFDAHFDLRNAYEGFTWSHASILFNVMDKIPGIEKLVQVGIRDFCEQEWEYANEQRKITGFLDAAIKRKLFEGKSWKAICQEIISGLPENVWITFDVDGLDPKLCPNTGTPVPGGLSYEEAAFLMRELVESGRKIAGFDLVEVAPDPKGQEWDGNVGARLLYKMSGLMAASHGKRELRKY